MTAIVEAMKQDGLTRQQAERVVRGFIHEIIQDGAVIVGWSRVGVFVVRESYRGRQYFDAEKGYELPF